MSLDIMDERIAKILEKFPFLSYGKMGETHYLGIILNRDNSLTAMYIIDSIADESNRAAFLEMGAKWWWESNRRIPINIFMRDFVRFKDCLKHFSSKDFELISGPAVSLQDTIARRVRKRQITLVRKLD